MDEGPSGLAAAQSGLDACAVEKIKPPRAMLGIDVGEDYLDLAALSDNNLRIARIALCDLEGDALAGLQSRLLQAYPGLGPGWLVAVDSPRLPRDLSVAHPWPGRRARVPRSRLLDQNLRALARRLDPPLRLSLFPTPTLRSFAAQMPACGKPHLQAAFAALFPGDHEIPGESSRGAALFTRFMLAGFLTFAALEALGACAVEAYPHLQWQLWSPLALAPKRDRRAALRTRASALRSLRRRLQVAAGEPATLDQADAEILAASTLLAARHGWLGLLRQRDEGAFLLAVRESLV